MDDTIVMEERLNSWLGNVDVKERPGGCSQSKHRYDRALVEMDVDEFLAKAYSSASI